MFTFSGCVNFPIHPAAAAIRITMLNFFISTFRTDNVRMDNVRAAGCTAGIRTLAPLSAPLPAA